eukprot:scaffold31_cov334-Pavlova_lutheri.AAC.54
MALARIRRLDASVSNRIAAGEVVQRPSSALKEVLENSLDAGSTQIAVSVKDGGHKAMSVQDNGHGISCEDLAILCERHTTSKLVQFEDLEDMHTLGFRGEALSSISFVAHLTVTTMTGQDRHAWKVTYNQGKMEEEGPKPCAGLPGTTILVEDLFYNVPTRRKALKHPSDEYGRILDVISKYAVLKQKVSFTCKKQGQNKPDLHSLGRGTRLDAIRAIYGTQTAKSMVEFKGTIEKGENSGTDISCKYEGYLSNANYLGKKTNFLLYINERVVECSPMKRALENVYSAVLPKASKPFIVLVLSLPPGHVDVNLHPTKREVGFLHQDELIGEMCKLVEARLLMSNDTRIFRSATRETQIDAMLGIRPSQRMEDKRGEEDEGKDSPSAHVEVSTQRAKAGGDHKLVRTDARIPLGSLEKFIKRPKRLSTSVDEKENPSSSPVEVQDRGVQVDQGASLCRAVRQKPNPPQPSELSSVQELLSEVDRDCHRGLLEVVRSHSYVGMADGSLALVQHQTKLYLLDMETLSRDMMYQQVLRRFEHFNQIRFSIPAPLKELLLLGLDEEEEEGNWSPEDGPKAEIADLSVKLLLDKAAMLAEYFGIEIDSQGNLLAIPTVIEEYVPDWFNLPKFVLSVVRDVNWKEEKACFHTVARCIAEFYQVSSRGVKPSTDPPEEDSPLCRNEEEFLWTIQHVLFPAMRNFLLPPRGRERDGSVVQVACLEKLYKIFERC